MHATADGVLLAFHDARARPGHRPPGGRSRHCRTTEIAQARIGGIDPIPTLAELFEAFPTARFNIDAKSDASVDLLAEAIAEHDAYDRVCVSSFGVGRLHRLRRRLGPRVASAASIAGVAFNRFVPWLTRALNTPASALQMPEYQRRSSGRRLRC